jgi:hypothetical protein
VEGVVDVGCRQPEQACDGEEIGAFVLGDHAILPGRSRERSEVVLVEYNSDHTIAAPVYATAA